MVNSQTQVVLSSAVRHVVQVSRGKSQTHVSITAKPHFFVISAGVQGPVGTVAEDVLAAAARAEQAANGALSLASTASLDLEQLVKGLDDAFAFHAGAISAQGG